MTLLRTILLALVLMLVGSRADALAPSMLSSVSLVDDGATTYANDDDVRLLGLELDAGAGADAANGGWVPAIVSFFIPGLGQIIWQGQVVKGLVMLGVAAVLSGVLWNANGFFGLLSFAYHLFAGYDAYMGGTVIPNFGGGGSGGDVGPERREEALVAARVLLARPVER